MSVNTWTSVTTTNSSPEMVLAHARHVRALGAERPVYFVDQIGNAESWKNIHLPHLAFIILCDDKYWSIHGGRPSNLIHRQLKNILYARAFLKVGWLAHIDIDEYLFSNIIINDMLSQMPTEVAEVRIQNCERIVSSASADWYDGLLRMPCWRAESLKEYNKSLLNFLGFGLAGYFHGKSFVRLRGDLRQGIHGALRKPPREVISYNAHIDEIMLVHYQYMNLDSYIKRMQSITSLGSARELHMVNQINWLAKQDFTKKAIIALAKMLYYADDKKRDQLLGLGLYREMPKRHVINMKTNLEIMEP